MIKFSYKPLWKMLIDLEMSDTEFRKKTNISKSTFYKMKHNKNITTEVLLRVCNEFNCDITNVLECIEE